MAICETPTYTFVALKDSPRFIHLTPIIRVSTKIQRDVILCSISHKIEFNIQHCHRETRKRSSRSGIVQKMGKGSEFYGRYEGHNDRWTIYTWSLFTMRISITYEFSKDQNFAGCHNVKCIKYSGKNIRLLSQRLYYNEEYK